MIFKENSATLVINGAWNDSIFSPEWISKFLFDGRDVSVEMPSLKRTKSIADKLVRFTSNKIRIQATNGFFIITALDYSNEELNNAENIANKIVEYLPHTPVTGFGFNIIFNAESCEQINNWFNKSNSQTVISEPYRLKTEEILKIYARDDYELSFRLRKGEDDNYTISFNFHFIVDNLISVKQKLGNYHFYKFKEEALGIMQSLFDLNL